MLTVAENRFARQAPFKSPLEGVIDYAWDAFVRAVSTRSIRDVSIGGGIGSFDLQPRRLGEIGVMENLRRENNRWIGDLTPKYEALRQNAILQYEVFVLSVKTYDEEKIARPEGVSRSGALVILQRGGVGALKAWPEGVFKTTKALFERANNLF